MKLVIEGARCTGKSTLAHDIHDLTDINVLHATSETDNTLQWHMAQLLSKDDMIMDRFQIGEIVYSLYYGRKPKLLLREMLMMPDLADDALFVVLFVTEENDLVKRLEKRKIETGRDYNAEDINSAQVANQFFKVIGELMMLEHDNVLCYDTSLIDIEDVIVEVEHEIRKRNLWR